MELDESPVAARTTETPGGWVSALERIEQLETALESRSVIARAQGILMERYSLDDEAAIAILMRTSNTMNIKVRDIAAILVDTRRLPGLNDR